MNIKAQRACPIGWILNQDYGVCYKISTKELARSWSEAKATCESYSAELTSFKDETEKKSIEKVLKGNINTQFWLGGTRRLSDFAWVWSDLRTYIPNSLM